MKPKPTIGQTLYALNIGAAASVSPQVLVPVTVKRVKRKYFWCATEAQPEARYWLRFFTEDWRQASPVETHCLFETQEAYAEARERAQICTDLAKMFTYGGGGFNLSLVALRQIVGVIKEAVAA